jgi:hypothetical protein
MRVEPLQDLRRHLRRPRVTSLPRCEIMTEPVNCEFVSFASRYYQPRFGRHRACAVPCRLPEHCRAGRAFRQRHNRRLASVPMAALDAPRIPSATGGARAKCSCDNIAYVSCLIWRRTWRKVSPNRLRHHGTEKQQRKEWRRIVSLQTASQRC